MGRELNVGLIGYGLAGRVFHAPVISSVPGLRLAMIAEAKYGVDAKKKYPEADVVSGADILLDNKDIDIVVIAVPNNYHYELGTKALLKGKHVVMEKPFTITSEDARNLIEKAGEAGRILTVHQNRRWAGDFKTTVKIAKSGLLGKLVEYESHLDRFRNYFITSAWREKNERGSGILYDIGVHLVDQAQCLFGLPQTVTADVRIQREGGNTDDSFEIILGYKTVKVTLKASMLTREAIPQIMLFGTEGSFVKYGLDPQEDALKKGFTPQDDNWGMEKEEQWGILNTQINGMHFRGRVETLPGSYQDFYRNLYEAVVDGKELAVKPEEAFEDIRIIELAQKSSIEKRTLRYPSGMSVNF